MLDFEKSLYEIKEKINSLKESQEKNDVDLQDEIDLLEASLERERKKIYTNLKPWDRVQIARLQERPTTLDYIPYIFDSFIELRSPCNSMDESKIYGIYLRLLIQKVHIREKQLKNEGKVNQLRKI